MGLHICTSRLKAPCQDHSPTSSSACPSEDDEDTPVSRLCNAAAASLGDSASTRPTLPLELWELIIDHVSHQSKGLVGFRTLRSCALTCRAWLPRSRMHLFRTLHIDSEAAFCALAARMTAAPHLAVHVRSLHIDCPAYEPIVRSLSEFPALFAQRLVRVRALALHGDDMRARDVLPLSPTFFSALAELASVTELALVWLTFESFADFVRLVCALPGLVTLSCINSASHDWVESGHNSYSPQRCLRLTTLRLEYFDFYEACSLLLMVHSALAHLSVGFKRPPSISMIEQELDLTQFCVLHTLTIFLSHADIVDGLSWVPALLAQLASPYLRSVRLVFQPDVVWTEDQWDLAGADHRRMDKILGSPAFAGTQCVRFDFTRVAMTRGDARALSENVRLWFPKLLARGVLSVELPAACSARAHGSRAPAASVVNRAGWNEPGNAKDASA